MTLRLQRPRVVIALATALFLLLPATGAPVRAATTYFVNDDASGANDGTSWANAFTDLQDALDAATNDDEIWVAGGTYRPSAPAGRNATFRPQDEVKVYGGFAGTETTLAQRHLELASTSVLSGDLGTPGESDNSYHVVTILATTGPTLDGFRIRDSLADDTINIYGQAGGGILNMGTGAKLSHLWVLENEAEVSGGVIYDASGTTSYSNILLDNNRANTGGGMTLALGAPVVNDTTFLSNDAALTGGALFIGGAATAYATNITVLGGSSGPGAAIEVQNTAQLFLTNASISGAASTGDSGAVSVNGAGAKALLRNIILWANPGGSATEMAGTLTIEDSIVEGGCPAGATCDANIIDEDPQFILPGADNGGFVLTLDLLPASPAIDSGTDNVCPSFDARGGDRNFDGDGDGDAACDIGSLEYIAPPAISLLAGLEFSESMNTVSVGLTLSHAYPDEVSVDIQHAGGTATPGKDFTGLPAVQVPIPANTTTYVFGLSIVDDQLHEFDETIDVQLAAPTGATLKAPTKTTFTIVDNEPAPLVSFVKATSSGREGVRKAKIVVALSVANGYESGVGLVVNGTADPGSDYRTPTLYITVPAGRKSAVIDLAVIDDGTPEKKETIRLRLAGGHGVVVDDDRRTHTYTIVDNDRATTCFGVATTLYGTPGADVIKGTPGVDVIDGRGGADRIAGLAGNDLVCGRGGGDIIRGGPGNDRVDGGNGADRLRGGNGNDRLFGAAGNDELLGETGRDALKGGPGADTCNGGAGTDALLAGHGCETVAGVP